MSEAIAQIGGGAEQARAAAGQAGPDAAQAPSAGALLRAAREQQGLHIGVLAASMKVAQRKLEALENDRHAELPDIAFTRALAQAVCRALKIDAAPVLARLPQAGDGQRLEHVATGLNTPFRDRDHGFDAERWALLGRPVFWATALVLAAAAMVAMLPDSFWSRWRPAGSAATDAAPISIVSMTTSTPTATAAVASTAATAAWAAPAAPPPAPTEGAGAALAMTGPPATPAAPVAAVAGVAAAEAQPSPAGAVAAAAGSEAAVPAPDTSVAVPATATAAPPEDTPPALAVLRTSGESWLEARDANGRVLVSRLVQPGETVGLDGPTPLRLRIGNARVVELESRGRPVNLSARTASNGVATVEIR